MPNPKLVLLLPVALGLLGAAAPVAAQQAGASPPVRQAAVRSEEPKLVFEREVFVYPGESRRDPFQPLGKRTVGPSFEELKLRMIIHSETASESVVVVADAAKKSYRLRRGESLGNATVLSITTSHVVFVVEDYGNRRQEILDLKPNKETEGA
jgi:hypothetical protein